MRPLRLPGSLSSLLHKHTMHTNMPPQIPTHLKVATTPTPAHCAIGGQADWLSPRLHWSRAGRPADLPTKAVVLFDEVDKAHPDVPTVLLQLFDEVRGEGVEREGVERGGREGVTWESMEDEE